MAKIEAHALKTLEVTQSMARATFGKDCLS